MMKEYFVIVNGQQQGPFTIEQLAEMAITPETEVWTAGMADWQQAGDVAELTSLLQQLQFRNHVEREALTPPPHASAGEAQWEREPQPMADAAPEPPVKPRREKSNSGCGVKILLTLLILVVLTGILALTCPTRQDHKDAIAQSTHRWMNEKIEAINNSYGRMPSIISGAIEWVTGQGTDFAIDSFLNVENYGVCSVGRIEMGDDSKMISLGVLNHVFTFDKDDVDEFLLDALKRKMGLDSAPVEPGTTPPSDNDSDDDDDSYLAPPIEDEDTSMDAITTPNPAEELLDSLAEQAKRQVIKTTKEWAKKQIDRIGNK